MANQGQVHSFIKGMNSDAAPLKQPEHTYIDALNVRLSPDENGTGHAVVNIEGTEKLIDLPTVPNIITITPDGAANLLWTATPTIVVDGITVVGTTISGNSNEFFDMIETAFSTDAAFAAYDLVVTRYGEKLRIYSPTHSLTNILPITHLDISIQAEIASEDQTIIGWVNVREEIYLFTTDDDTVTGGNGTIWKLYYDRATYTNSSFDLIYSDELNFSTQYPIANPSGIEAAYENPEYLRITWTDNFNQLRFINVYDPNTLAVTPTVLGIQNDISLQVPIFKEIKIGGNLLAGAYQAAYRLRSSAGGYTLMSPVSDVVPVVEDAESFGNIYDHLGSPLGTQTNKSLTFLIDNIDTEYDFIEVFSLFRNADGAIPEVLLVGEIPISSASLNYTITGNEDSATFSYEEFLDLKPPFKFCKTLAQKDNILFAANVSDTLFDVDFDPRMYGHDQNGNSYVDINGGVYPTDQTIDAYNSDPEIYRFRSNGIGAGGTGQNGSYTFINRRIDLDVRTGVPEQMIHSRLLNSLSAANTTVGGQSKYDGDHFAHHGSPYYSAAYTGYRRGETYRFSWVPVKDGVEGTAKWIADIRIPFENEVNKYTPTGGIAGSDQQQLKMVHKDGSGHYYATSIGIEFTFNLQSLGTDIDGFKIKRVKREDEDRSVIGSGIITQMVGPSYVNDYPGHYLNYSQSIPGSIEGTATDQDNSLTSTDRVAFYCPEFNFGKNLTHRAGDRLHVATQYDVTTLNGTFGQGDIYNITQFKLFHHNTNTFVNPSYFQVEDAQQCESGASVMVDGINCNNRSITTTSTVPGSGNAGTYQHTLGARCVMLKTDNIIPTSILSQYKPAWSYWGANMPNKLYVHYLRQVDKQYGGYTYAERSLNTYIDTGTNVAVEYTPGILTNTYTVDVFGGDTFITAMDIMAQRRNLTVPHTGGTPEKGQTFGITHYFPVESSVNIDLRSGEYYNASPEQLTAGDNTLATADWDGYVPTRLEAEGEHWEYNWAYSEQNSLTPSFPEAVSGDANLEFSERIYATLPKTKGELVDSWRNFATERYIDVDGNQGPINAIVNSQDKLIALQDTAVGIASVNERQTTTTTTGQSLILGSSGVLSRFDYVTVEAGTQHQFGLVKSPSSLYFFDATDSTIYKYSAQGIVPLSVFKGVSQYLYNNTRENLLLYDNPAHLVSTPTEKFHRGVTGTFDNRFDEVLLTFHATTDQNKDEVGEPFTIVYDEKRELFTSRYGFTPTMYINDNVNVFAPGPILQGASFQNSIYRHNAGARGVFYDQDAQPSHITFVSNKHPNMSKVYTNLEWNTEVYDSSGANLFDSTVDGIVITNNYQDTGEFDRFKRRFRTWRATIPRNENTKERMRDHFAITKFEFDNLDDRKIVLNDVTMLYQVLPI